MNDSPQLTTRCPKMTLHLGQADAAFVVLSSRWWLHLLPLLAACCWLRQGDSPASTGGGWRLPHWSGTNLPVEGGVCQRGTWPSSLFLLRSSRECGMLVGAEEMSSTIAWDKLLPFFLVLRELHVSVTRDRRDLCVGCRKTSSGKLPWWKKIDCDVIGDLTSLFANYLVLISLIT